MGLIKKIKELDKKTRGRLWLIPGLFCAIFAGGIYSSALLAWFFPVFLWKVAISTKKNNVVNYVLIAVVLWISAVFKYNGSINGEGLAFHIFFLLIYPAFFIWPFVISGVLYRKLNNTIIKILLLPVMWTICDWLASFACVGSMASLSGSQYEFYLLIQLASITGLYGITFFMVFIGTFFVELWINGFHIKGNKKLQHALILTICLVSFVFLYGSFRLTFYESTGKTMRVASVLNFYSCKGDYTMDEIRSKFTDENFKVELDGMSSDVAAAKNANAEIAMWQEDCFPIKEKNFEALIEQGQKLAKQYNIALIIPMEVSRGDQLLLNQIAMINNNGNIDYIYQKVNLVPFVETGRYVQGTNDIYCTEVNGVNVSSCICFDAINPNFIQESLDKSTDVLLVPAWEWEAIGSYAGTCSIIRSVEQGVSYVRNTSMGFSVAVDQYGWPTTWHKTSDSNKEIVFSDVPTNSIFTFYKYTGNWIIYLSIAYMVGIIIYVSAKKIRRKRS